MVTAERVDGASLFAMVNTTFSWLNIAPSERTFSRRSRFLNDFDVELLDRIPAEEEPEEHVEVPPLRLKLRRVGRDVTDGGVTGRIPAFASGRDLGRVGLELPSHRLGVLDDSIREPIDLACSGEEVGVPFRPVFGRRRE